MGPPTDGCALTYVETVMIDCAMPVLALARRSNSQGVGFTPYSAHRTRSENAFEISSGVKVQWP